MSCHCAQTKNESADPLYQQLDEVIKKYKGQVGALIPVLHEAQEIFGYLPENVQMYIAEALEVPVSEIYGVVSFYSLFTTEPRGKYVINICLGTACYVKGSGRIMEKAKEELGIEVGGTTKDGLFTLKGCRCLGACGLAPVLTVNDKVHGRLTEDDIPELIRYYKMKAEQAV